MVKKKLKKGEFFFKKSLCLFSYCGMSVIIVIGCIALAPGTGGASLGGIAFA